MAAEDQRPIGSGFGRSSEPQDVLAGIDLSGKVAIVTGGYSGIGVETVRALAGVGATVVVPARDHGRAAAGLANVAGDITIVAMDLADIGSVRRFGEQFAKTHGRLDLLINNAGVMACPLSHTAQGWEMQFGTNHMGHFALAKALMPLLETTPGTRVVALSSTAHKLCDMRWDDPNWESGDYNKWHAYGQSKTADALFAVGLNSRLTPSGGTANAVHPGGIVTPLQRHLQTEEMVAMGWLGSDGQISESAKAMFKTATQGCTTTLWAATSPMLEGRGGLYCEDCDVAALSGTETQRYAKVEPYAVDPDSAERLWDLSEKLLAAA